jgi:hypothetical protein
MRLETSSLANAVERVRARPWLLALAFYCVWSLVATYPLALAPANHLDNWGDAAFNTWVMAWDLHQLPRDPLHLFDAPIFYPAHDALALSDTMLGQAIEALPVVALTGNYVLAYNVTVLLSFVLCGLGAYLLAREAVSPAASLVAGAVYAYSFFRVGEYLHLQILSAQWIPFALLALHRLWKDQTWRWAILFALAIIAEMLCSFYLGLFLLPALAFAAVAHSVATHHLPGPRLVGRLAAASILVVAVVLPLSLPYFRVATEFHLDRTLDDAIGGAASLRNYLAAPPTSLLYGSPTVPLIQHVETDETLFPGLVTLALALVGVCFRRPSGWRGFYVGLAGLGLIFSLGPQLKVGADPFGNAWLPYRLLYDYAPGFHAIRVPGRFGVIATLGIAGLAALGASSLLRHLPAKRQWILGLGLAVAVGAETLSVPTRMTPIETPSEVPPVYRWLAQRPNNLPMLELPTVEARWLNQVPEMERQGHEQYLSIFHWHPTPSGYSGFFPPLFWSVIREAKEVPSEESLAFLQSIGVKYLLFHQDQYPEDRWQQIVSGLQAAPNVERPLAHFGNDWVYSLITPRTIGMLPPSRLILPSAVSPGDDYRGFVNWENPNPVARLANPSQIQVSVNWTGPSEQTDEVTAKEPTLLAQGDTTAPFDVTAPTRPGRYILTVSTPSVSSSADVDVETVQQPATLDTSHAAMQLRGARLVTPTVRNGQTLFVLAEWALRRRTIDNYLVEVDVLGQSNEVVASSTVDPFNGELETSRWLPFEVVGIDQSAIIPRELAPGQYDVRLLVRFADGAAWQIVNRDGVEVASVTIGKVTIAA